MSDILIDDAPRTRLATVTTNGQGTTNWVPIPITPAMIGTERCFQFLVRDPAAPGGANLSPAVHVDFCP